jgi:ketosteroid isomerase-like protein
MQPVLEAIHEYYATFSTLDLNAIVSHYSEPCFSIGPQGLFSAGTRAGLANAFAPMVEGLRAKGYGRSEFTDAEVTMLGETAALARGVAVRYTAAGQEMERVRISYLMHRTDSVWKIAAIVVAV